MALTPFLYQLAQHDPLEIVLHGSTPVAVGGVQVDEEMLTKVPLNPVTYESAKYLSMRKVSLAYVAATASERQTRILKFILNY